MPDAFKAAQWIEHQTGSSFARKARVAEEHMSSYMSDANIDAEDPSKWDLDNAMHPKLLASGQAEEQLQGFLPDGDLTSNSIFDFYARKKGYRGVQVMPSSEHKLGYRLPGGLHIGFDELHKGGFRWRVHRDYFDALALGGAGNIAHGAYEGWKHSTRLFRALTMYGYRFRF